MSNAASNELMNLVNASGFAFQMAVEDQIRSSLSSKISKITSEHPWSDVRTGQEGFIDLLLEQGNITWVVECKRPKDATWVFLAPTDHSKTISALCCLWIAGGTNGRSIVGWDEVNLNPASSESMFCVVRGSGENDRPLLERIASQLVTSTNCLVDEQIGLLKKTPKEFIHVYILVIVTTAALQVCRFDPSSVSLKDGIVPNGEFQEVPFVRFRKSFSAVPPLSLPAPSSLKIGQESEPTVLVINAGHLISVMTDAAIKLKDEHFDEWPWKKALKHLGGR